MRKFRIINGYRINYYWDAPAIYEHKIELRRVRENHHPDYRQNIERNRDRNNHTSKIFQRPSRNNYDVNRKRANTSLSNLSQREDSESVGITVTVSPYYSTLVWEDGFESYQGGAFPSATWTPDANASASYVDNTVSFEGTKSLRHIGALGVCWGALAYRPITVSPPYEIEFIVRNGNESLSGCHPDRAYIGIRKGFGWLNPSRSFITFTGDGSIISSSGASLRTYETLNWYRVRIRYERPSSSEVKVSYWIDDTFVGNETLQARAEEDQMTNIDLTLQEGTAWFDAVKVFQD